MIDKGGDKVKRDMELVREVLMNLENNDDVNKWGPVNIDGYKTKEISYHLKILSQANLIEAKRITDQGIWFAKSLTWNGHEYLDAIRSETIWNKTKNFINEKGLELTAVPLGVIKEIAVTKGKEFLGIE